MFPLIVRRWMTDSAQLVGAYLSHQWVTAMKNPMANSARQTDITSVSGMNRLIRRSPILYRYKSISTTFALVLSSLSVAAFGSLVNSSVCYTNNNNIAISLDCRLLNRDSDIYSTEYVAECE